MNYNESINSLKKNIQKTNNNVKNETNKDNYIKKLEDKIAKQQEEINNLHERNKSKNIKKNNKSLLDKFDMIKNKEI